MCSNKYYIDRGCLQNRSVQQNSDMFLGDVQVFNTRRHQCTLCVSTQSNLGLADPQIYTLGRIRSASPGAHRQRFKDSIYLTV